MCLTELRANLGVANNAGTSVSLAAAAQETTMELVTQLVPFAALFVAVGWLHWLPDGLVNMPNKTYWLAPDRREGTLAAFRDWIRSLLVIVNTVLALVMVATLHANLMPTPHLGLLAPWLLIPLILAPMIGMIGWLFWRFRVPSG